jgi:histidyl-tRNA synthetase
MKLNRCRGMRDLLPAEMAVFHFVEGICRETCLKWGYQEVRTPTIEYLHLFTSAGTLTPDKLGKVYSFLDWDGWSGERVVLRPDGTIPVARLYAENMENGELARLFYASNIFIFDEVGESTRERWQCGAELIGSAAAMADVELITLATEIIEKLGVRNIELRLSHAGMIKTLLGKIGISIEEQNRLFDRILEGKPEAIARIIGDKPEYQKVLLALLNSKGQSPDFIRRQRAGLLKDVSDICSELDNLIRITELLDSLGWRYEIDIASGAGFEYYTGMIFQLYAGGEKVGGGGRYDALIPSMGGGDVPACGFALYLDSLIKLVKPGSPEPPRILVKMRSGEKGIEKMAFQLADCLRQAGYAAVVDLGVKASGDFRWVIEVSQETPVLRVWDIVRSTQAGMPTVDDVIKYVEENRGGKAGSA